MVAVGQRTSGETVQEHPRSSRPRLARTLNTPRGSGALQSPRFIARPCSGGLGWREAGGHGPEPFSATISRLRRREAERL